MPALGTAPTTGRYTAGEGLSALGFGKGSDKEAEKPPLKLHDDFSYDGSTLSHLDNPDLSEEESERLNETFEYLSATMDLESGTERVAVLQDLADKMAEGEDIGETRVVVMNRGEVPDAFVTPDGTIFLSQSLINLMDLDETAAVIAHETNHLINRTYQTAAKKDNLVYGVGVRWLHEIVGDIQSPRLLAKAGMNSMALASSIQRARGSRSLIYMTDEARATAVMASHKAVNYSTSAKPHDPLPPTLKNKPVKTNSELVNTAQEEGRLAELSTQLHLLHPRDLGELFKRYNGISDLESDESSLRLSILNLVGSRLCMEGFSLADTFAVNKLLDELCSDITVSAIHNKEESVPSLVDYEEELWTAKMSKAADKAVDILGGAIALKRHNYRGILIEKMRVVYKQGRDEFGPGRENMLGFISGVSAKDSELQFECSRLLTEYLFNRKFNLDSQPVITASSDDLVDLIREFEERGGVVDPRGILFGIADINKRFREKSHVEDDWMSIEDARMLFAEKVPEALGDILEHFEGEMLASGRDEGDGFKRRYGLSDLIPEVNRFFREHSVDDDEKGRYLKDVEDSVFRAFSGRERYGWDMFDGMRPASGSRIEELNTKGRYMWETHIKLTLAMGLFRNDSTAFYDYVEDAMTGLYSNVPDLSYVQLAGIASPLLLGTASREVRGVRSNLLTFNEQTQETDTRSVVRSTLGRAGIDFVEITDWESFNSLSLVQKLIDEPLDMPDVHSPQELWDWTQDLFRTTRDHDSMVYADNEDQFLGEGYEYVEFERDLYRGDLYTILVLAPVRQKMQELVAQDVGAREYNYLGALIKNYLSPEEPMRRRFLRSIHERYLGSSEIGLDSKLEYFKRNHRMAGIEGAVTLADQITNMEDYLKLREVLQETGLNYMEEATEDVQTAAAVDYATSLLAEQYEVLIQTCGDDETAKLKASTKFAEFWVRMSMSDIKPFTETSYNTKYDEENDQIIVDSSSRLAFRSFADSVQILQDLSPAERFTVAMKVLLDQGGILTTEEGRAYLGREIPSVLGVSGFPAAAFEGLMKTAEAQDIAMPAIAVLSSLMFRALDAKKVETEALMNTSIAMDYQSGERTRVRDIKGMSADRLTRLLLSSTRELRAYGAQYSGDETGVFKSKAGRSADQYQDTVDFLEDALLEDASEGIILESDVDPATEVLIRGMQTLDPVGVRMMQLAEQFYDLEEPVRRRLSQTLDSNPGMNKLQLWENLYLMREEAVRNGNTERADFIRSVTHIGGYMGGGSIYSTYAAERTMPSGETAEIALKMRNPNAIAFVNRTYAMVSGALEWVEEFGSKDERKDARKARAILDLAQQWCLRDMADPNFEADDLPYREVAAEFNRREGYEAIVIPRLHYHDEELTAEERMHGSTLNSMLDDKSVSPPTKTAAIKLKSRFLAHQIDTTSPDGTRIVHADPHPGNYIYLIDPEQDANSGNRPKIAVIDRHMQLHLQAQDALLARILALPEVRIDGELEEASGQVFMDTFVDHILERNKVTDAAQQKRIRRHIQRSLRRQVVTAFLKRRRLEPFDIFETLVTSIAELNQGRSSSLNLSIPLEMRLYLKNVITDARLLERYGLKQESLWQEAIGA